MESTPKASNRRRRLVERGSDRLAFITGQARELPSDPCSDSPVSATASSRVPELLRSEGGIGSDNIIQLQKSEPSDLFPAIQPTGEAPQQKVKDKTQSNEVELLRKFNTSSAVPEIQPVNEPLLRRHDHETISKKMSDGSEANAQPSRVTEIRTRSVPPNQSNQADNRAWSLETLKELLDFTPHEISQAISATECTRFLASVAIAFLVILSNFGLDVVGGTLTKVLVGTRPLLFVVVTHITIVVTLLMENKDPNARGRPASSNLGSADSLGQLLEIGFLLQKASGALVMDCSVCAVIMICFLGF